MAAKIFINYRRNDTTGTAGRLHDRLAQSFGRKNLFMDVDHMPAGIDFVSYLDRQVAACNVFLALIGPGWLDVRNENGDRRLYDADDFVAIEIAAALARNIRVIPVLVDGARMPKASELPELLKPLVRRHAVEVRHAQFGRDTDALIAEVAETFEGGWLRPRPRRTVALSGILVTVTLLVGSIGLYWSPHRSAAAYVASTAQPLNSTDLAPRLFSSKDPLQFPNKARSSDTFLNAAASTGEPDRSLSKDARDRDFANLRAFDKARFRIAAGAQRRAKSHGQTGEISHQADQGLLGRAEACIATPLSRA
jgi:hypothetical protein